jgi:hypothetical protein
LGEHFQALARRDLCFALLPGARFPDEPAPGQFRDDRTTRFDLIRLGRSELASEVNECQARIGMKGGMVTVAVDQSIWRAALFLTMPDPAAHPALLAPYLAASFASATTGHAFSSGVSGKYPELNNNRRDALGVDQKAYSTRKSVIISRSVVCGPWSVVRCPLSIVRGQFKDACVVRFWCFRCGLASFHCLSKLPSTIGLSHSILPTDY